MKIATPEQMCEMDRQTILDYEIPGLILMENAALRVVETLQQHYAPLLNKRVTIVCGKGNNGGDGLAIARHLASRHNVKVTVLLTDKPEAFKGDTLANYKMVQNYELIVRSAKDFNFTNSELIIDAIFGTGFKGQVDDEISVVIDKINNSLKKIISVDVPSGLDANTGKVNGAVIQATLTVTFGLPKYGLLVYPGVDYVGELILADIGIPNIVIEAAEINTYATEITDVATWLPIRKNKRDANKGHYGHSIIFTGSNGFAGAPILVAEAAQRAGTGLVTLVVPENLYPSVVSQVSPVVMTLALPQTQASTFSMHAIEAAVALIENATAVAIGPGLGLTEEVSEFVRQIIIRCPVPLVIDADALNILSKMPDRGQSIIRKRKVATIITPHPSEMAGLLNVKTIDVQNDRLKIIKNAIEYYQCVVLLKGSRTLIGDSSGAIYLNTTGNAGMATGGSGDVLTGIIAGLLGQKLEALPAAVAAAYIHGLAGELTAKKNGGTIGLIATDLIQYLPKAIAYCQRTKKWNSINI